MVIMNIYCFSMRYHFIIIFKLIGAIFSVEWLFNMYVSPEHVVVSFFEIENLMDALMIF